MAQIGSDCPHCLVVNSAFTPVSSPQRYNPKTNECTLFFTCNSCSGGIVVRMEKEPGLAVYWLNGSDPVQPKILNIWPKPMQLPIPSHLPANVRAFFFQAKDSLQRSNWDAAGTMFRKALQASLRKLLPEGPSNLAAHIRALSADQGVTPAMKEWADAIRHLGNDAAHEEEPFTEQEARSIDAFTEMFLTYVFSMPGMLQERKSDAPPPG